MADDTPVFLTKDAANRMAAATLDFERNSQPPRGPKHRRGGDRPPIRAILLEDLVSGGTADAAVTVLVTSPAIQKVALLGNPPTTPTPMTFQLQFKGQTTTAIPYKSTADVVQAALVALSTIGPGNVTVALGDLPAASGRPEEFPGLWLVSFVGVFLSRDPSTIPLLTIILSTNNGGLAAAVIANEQWADSGEVETVNAITPVGTPTPMRAGAVVTAIQFPSIGYGVITCEPRNFGTPY